MQNYMKTDVTFESVGIKIAGHLYSPKGEVDVPRPAIVIGHPGTAVKEQSAGLYAKRLAEKGLITLTFDAAYQGESGGEPRGLEDPYHRVEDFKAAVSFLSIRNDVDPERIGALGICASGGYVIPATVTDHRIKAVATVSAADIHLQFRKGSDGKQDPAIFRSMLDAAVQARTSQARGEGIGVFPIFPETEDQARAMGDLHAFEGWEYYCTDRAQHQRSAKFFTWDSIDRIAYFEAFRFIDQISPRPLLMIAGNQAVTSWMTTDAIAKAKEPKELFWLDGATHVDTYDKDEYVTTAISKLAEFFRTHLSQSGLV
ncbi:alpha/beta hydrolase [Paenibacillus glycanilyticus]|uniref:alpha/beta hydrolase n=1 Tax=Paenibacillus glycanilyticus TaxID=126569 RepID=UPI001910DF95|nr:alpha/beta hydrolase [Paenibacillus glycanilyticus]